MQTKLDEAKAELLERAARVAENSPVGGHLPTGTTSEGTPDRDTVLAFLQRYYLHTAPEDLTDRDPVDVFGAALSHYRLAENRPQGTANVRVHTPTVEENGWTCSHSVVEVVTDGQGYSATRVEYQLTRWLSLLSTVSTVIGCKASTMMLPSLKSGWTTPSPSIVMPSLTSPPPARKSAIVTNTLPASMGFHM